MRTWELWNVHQGFGGFQGGHWVQTYRISKMDENQSGVFPNSKLHTLLLTGKISINIYPGACSSESTAYTLHYPSTLLTSRVRMVRRVVVLLSRNILHDDVIKWKHFPRYFVWEIHRSPVNSPHKGQWGGAWVFSLICAWINAWVNNREAGDLGRYPAHHDVTVMVQAIIQYNPPETT